VSTRPPIIRLYADATPGEPFGGVWICGHSFDRAWRIPNDPTHPTCLRTLVGRCEFCGEVRIFVYCEPLKRLLQAASGGGGEVGGR
jgi:hypothetical protein